MPFGNSIAPTLRGTDRNRCSQAKGLIHTSPGQRPGFPCGFVLLQAIGLRHRVLWVRLAQIPTRRRDQASIPQDNEPRFQRSEWSLADKPRALPWAGMNDAVGVPNRPAVPPWQFSWCLSGTKARLNFRKALGLACPEHPSSACRVASVEGGRPPAVAVRSGHRTPENRLPSTWHRFCSATLGPRLPALAALAANGSMADPALRMGFVLTRDRCR